MAIIDIEATVTAPSKINIPLVRADQHGVSNIFRVAFEFFLACFSATLGSVLAMPKPETIYFIVLVICGLVAAAFGGLSYSYGKSSGTV